ncbi:MAG TPA: holo-ACP synthase [Terriglobales bacterium]
MPTKESAKGIFVILGIGIDLIDHVRVQRELERSPWEGTDGIFTPKEIARCRASKRSVARYAACFAAKEATLKALGLEVGDLGMFREVELTEGGKGEHGVLLHGRIRAKSDQLGVRRIRLSITTAKKLTSAMVVLEH